MGEMNDLVFKADKFQSHAKKPYECHVPSHGRLWPHASGAVLMCVSKGCDFAIALSPHMLTEDES